MATRRPSHPPEKRPSTEFSTYPLEKLLILWKQEELTVEQLAGHLLQHLLEQDQRLRRLEQPSAPSAP